jgi:hypothetical protein
VLTVRLNVDGLNVDDGEDTILWTGEIGEAGFPVRVPQDAAHGATHGLATIHWDGMQIAKIHFAIHVGAAAATSEDPPSREERHRTAFASYASQDRDRVVARVQGLKKAGVDVFMDIVDLRAGQLWEEALWREIPARDIFYLFCIADEGARIHRPGAACFSRRREAAARTGRQALQRRAAGVREAAVV